MEIHIIELPGLNRFQNDVCRGVRRESEKPNPPFPLQLPRGRHTAILLQRPLQELAMIDPVQRQQINMVESEILHRLVERPQELLWIFEWRHFRLYNDLFPWQTRKHAPELHLRTPVATSGFDMVDAQLHRPMNRRFEIRLILRRDLPRRHILPLVLVPHASAREDWHPQLGAAKATVLHLHRYATNAQLRAIFQRPNGRKSAC